MIKIRRFEVIGRLGLFLADVGHWLAGYKWRVNLYEEGMEHALLYPQDCREYLSHSEEEE